MTAECWKNRNLKNQSNVIIRIQGGNRPLSAFLVDVDNTLVDVKRRDYQSFLDTALEMGIVPMEFHEFTAMRLRGGSSREIGTELLARSGRLQALETFLSTRHSRLDRPELFELDTLFPGVQETLGRITGAGLPVVAATLRHDGDLLEKELERLGIRHFFSGIFTAGDIRGQA
ncbi:MAG: HAD family hydrolase, partial [Acidobacteria bacterium]|nr:HAD family hydrolase [Acidobacteriota bacterium]